MSSNLLFLSDEVVNPTQVAHKGDRAVIYWLVACAITVLGMILLGGATRLTGSGLSMVDWRPIMGIIPPLDHQSWQVVFEQYKLFPEYQFVNNGISLDAFKVLFWYEYGHRLLGRFIGILFFLPMVYFWFTGQLPRCLKPHLVILLVLGGLQGLLGWYMVKSGLIDDPHVSQYRLMSHLCLAVLILGYIVFLSLELKFSTKVQLLRNRGQATRFPMLLLFLVFLMIALGGLVAGTKAGQIYNTFPDMNGEFVPTGLLALNPVWLNFFENPVLIQFSHRLVAWMLLLAAIFNVLNVLRTRAEKLLVPSVLLGLATLGQGALGVYTLLERVPVNLGVLHQGGAMIVFIIAVLLYQRSRHVELSSQT